MYFAYTTYKKYVAYATYIRYVAYDIHEVLCIRYIH